MWLVGAVNEYADGRVQRRSGADATNRQIGEIFRRCKISLTEIETRGNREHVGNVCRSLSIEFFAAYGGHRYPHILETFLPAPRGNPNLFPPVARISLSRPGGGRGTRPATKNKIPH